MLWKTRKNSLRKCADKGILHMCKNVPDHIVKEAAQMCIVSQFPVEKWYDMFSNATYAEACLSRITDKKHAYRLEMNGRSMRG